ncbi:MAG: galactosyltransferase-related protein, partial [bacterium]
LNKGRINLSLEEGFIIKNKALRKVLTNPDEHILGCNFSIEKVLLEKINGFDENYEGPGIGEDSDLEFRLRLTGAKFKSVRYLAVQYHLYHVETIEDPGNLEYFNKMKENREYFCKNGLLK